MSIGLGWLVLFHFIHFDHIDFQFKIFSLSLSPEFRHFISCVPKLNFIDFSRFRFDCILFFLFKLLLIFFSGSHIYFDTSNNMFPIEFPPVFLFQSMSVSYTFQLMSLISSRLITTDTHKRPTHRLRARERTHQIKNMIPNR